MSIAASPRATLAFPLRPTTTLPGDRAVVVQTVFQLIADDPDQQRTALTIAGNLTEDHSVEIDDIAIVARYHEESLYSQRRAAAYLRETAAVIREEFPDPAETSVEERKYGGIVSAGGRRGSVFSALLESVEPDPGRFSESITEPTLVEAGPEAKRTERALGLDSELVY